MLALAPWVVPLSIILICLFVVVFAIQLDKRTSIDSDFMGLLVVTFLAIAIGALGSLITLLVI